MCCSSSGPTASGEEIPKFKQKTSASKKKKSGHLVNLIEGFNFNGTPPTLFSFKFKSTMLTKNSQGFKKEKFVMLLIYLTLLPYCMTGCESHWFCLQHLARGWPEVCMLPLPLLNSGDNFCSTPNDFLGYQQPLISHVIRRTLQPVTVTVGPQRLCNCPMLSEQ